MTARNPLHDSKGQWVTCARSRTPPISNRADTQVGPYDGIPHDDRVGAQFIAPVIYRKRVSGTRN